MRLTVNTTEQLNRIFCSQFISAGQIHSAYFDECQTGCVCVFFFGIDLCCFFGVKDEGLLHWDTATSFLGHTHKPMIHFHVMASKKIAGLFVESVVTHIDMILLVLLSHRAHTFFISQVLVRYFLSINFFA